MLPFSLKVVCAIAAIILSVLILLGGDDETARQIVFAAVALIFVAVGLIVP